MAFNPFEAFSIRSKLGRSVMAILGIVVMLTFVLSTGMMGQGNDFFDQIGAMFGTKGKTQVVAVGYGVDIHDSDLAEVRRQHLAATSFLNMAVDSSYTNLVQDLSCIVIFENVFALVSMHLFVNLITAGKTIVLFLANCAH